MLPVIKEEYGDIEAVTAAEGGIYFRNQIHQAGSPRAYYRQTHLELSRMPHRGIRYPLTYVHEWIAEEGSTPNVAAEQQEAFKQGYLLLAHVAIHFVTRKAIDRYEKLLVAKLPNPKQVPKSAMTDALHAYGDEGYHVYGQPYHGKLEECAESLVENATNFLYFKIGAGIVAHTMHDMYVAIAQEYADSPAVNQTDDEFAADFHRHFPSFGQDM